jgi:hypothetical protein
MTTAAVQISTVKPRELLSLVIFTPRAAITLYPYVARPALRTSGAVEVEGWGRGALATHGCAPAAIAAAYWPVNSNPSSVKCQLQSQQVHLIMISYPDHGKARKLCGSAPRTMAKPPTASSQVGTLALEETSVSLQIW